jgi:Holliday junction DNA helicase RuvA
MIALIHGEVVALEGRTVTVDTGGVGYAVNVPTRVHESCTPGTTVRLYTHLDVREDDLVLFGFLSAPERRLFLMLTSVTGVGGSLAMNALDTFDPATLRQAIARADTTTLCRISGVGRKTAARIALELQEKVAALDLDGVPALDVVPRPKTADDTLFDDVRSALVNLDFATARVDAVIRLLESEPGPRTFDALLKRGLVLLR